MRTTFFLTLMAVPMLFANCRAKQEKPPELTKTDPTIGIGVLEVSLNRDIPLYRDMDSEEGFDTLRFSVIKTGSKKRKYLMTSNHELGIDYFPGHSKEEAEKYANMGLVGLGPHLSFTVIEERDGMYCVILNDHWDTAVIKREDDRELYLQGTTGWEWSHSSCMTCPPWFLYETWETCLKRMEYVSVNPTYGELYDAPHGKRIKQTEYVSGRVVEMDGQWIRLEQYSHEQKRRESWWARWTDGVGLLVSLVSATYE